MLEWLSELMARMGAREQAALDAAEQCAGDSMAALRLAHQWRACAWKAVRVMLQQAAAAHPEDAIGAGLMELGGRGYVSLYRSGDEWVLYWADHDTEKSPDLSALIAAALAAVKGETVADEAAPAPSPTLCPACGQPGDGTPGGWFFHLGHACGPVAPAPEPTPEQVMAEVQRLYAETARELMAECNAKWAKDNVKTLHDDLRELVLLGREQTAYLRALAAECGVQKSQTATAAWAEANAARAARRALEAEEEQA